MKHCLPRQVIFGPFYAPGYEQDDATCSMLASPCGGVQEFKRIGGIWIMKPIGSAQGKGIFLFTRLSEISEWKYDFRAKGQQAAGGAAKEEGAKDVEQYIVQVCAKV